MTAEQLRMSIINEAFKGDWEMVSLGDVCAHENGDRGKNYPSKDKLGHVGIPFISALNLANNTIIDDDKLLKASEVQFNNLRSGHLKKGDFVVCIRGSIGKHGIYPFEKGAIASSLVILRPDESKLNLMWLSYYFDSGLFQDSLSESQNGTAQPNLGAKELMKFELPIPPLAEQKRIVAKLEELLPIVEQYGKAQTELDELNAALPARLRQSILQQAIQGKLVPQDPNEGTAEELLKDIGKLPITTDSEYILPENWNTVGLMDICQIDTGKWDANHATQKGKYRFYTCSAQYMYSDTKRFSGECLIVPGNGDIGAVYYYSGEFDAYQRTYILHDILIDSRYLYYHLLSNWRSYNLNLSYGSTIKYVRIGNFKNYIVNLPPLAEQQRIVAKIEELFTQIDKITK